MGKKQKTKEKEIMRELIDGGLSVKDKPMSYVAGARLCMRHRVFGDRLYPCEDKSFIKGFNKASIILDKLGYIKEN